MAEQLAFDLHSKPALGREDFFISPANAVAVATLAAPEAWPNGKMALVGPRGTGKTHLAHVFAAETGARIVPARRLAAENIEALAAGPVVVEDVPDIAGDAEAEAALFHLHNLALASGSALLVTGSTPPSRWPIALPDLASRMQGTAITQIEPPDDALLSAVLLKLFNDRQTPLDPAVIPYLVSRMERALGSAADLVTALDTAALARRQPVTRPLAARVLESHCSPAASASS
ncbi:DnaA regulatory inactivator Hda [Pseudoruegeria aquimaris]|uniref:DnaA regulatory inactivator Hda n=1 Tax=Pseudoruegeria aquimaris TaxID=393663 RepID=A0A1Y5SG43_9RHOB|nr:DnaA/Hda family protein [Pseudoruegeria aquimaris]SLN39322.1 DnaA regulatory inactivator Hda [Pseudoruegeria aquimaris]